MNHNYPMGPTNRIKLISLIRQDNTENGIWFAVNEMLRVVRSELKEEERLDLADGFYFLWLSAVKQEQVSVEELCESCAEAAGYELGSNNFTKWMDMEVD